MLTFYVYILKCSDQSYYIGHTNDIEQRLAEHTSNKMPSYTSKRLPVDLVFAQDFATREEAIEMEQQIKKWSRKKKEALINQNWNQLSLLAKKKFSRIHGSIRFSRKITHHEPMS